MVFIIALLFSLVAYANILLAVSQTRQTQFRRSRASARAVAEAGYIIAKERLWVNPDYCGGTQLIDSNADGILTPGVDLAVLITVTSCGAANSHRIITKVAY
jgi:hypothetical protein